MDNSENEVLKLQKEKKGKNIVIIILVFIVALLLGIILGQYIPNNKNYFPGIHIRAFQPFHPPK